MTEDVKKMKLQVEEYKNNLIAKAEKLILTGFPEKIIKLNDLLATPLFKNRDFAEVNQPLNIPVPDPVPLNSHEEEEPPPTKRAKVEAPSGTKVMSLSSGIVTCNAPICELIKLVKPVIRSLVEDSNILKMWISFLIPKIEDGNNFGVSIQEDTLSEIQSVESESAAFFEQISRYFISRAKVISKVAKYPHIEDYRRAVEELDQKEYLSLWLMMCEVRNRYCSLHDIVIKNLEKLKKPRSSNAENLY